MYNIGNKGNTYYIICDETDEAATFSMFGEHTGFTTRRLALVELFNKKVEVDVISVLGNPMNTTSDVYFNGSRAIAKGSYLDVVNKLQGKFRQYKQNNIMYRVPHEEDYTQVLLVYRKGMIRISELCDALGIQKESFVKIN